ncbi:hypothetical protein V5799_007336, partial [Amblyomma americanum]
MKVLLCQFCLLVLLLRPGSGVPCNGESYQALRRQCVLGLQQKVKAVRGDLTQNCRDFVNFTTCLRDSWNASYCGNATDEAWKNDTLFNRVEKKYFPDCPALQKGTTACNRQRFVNDMFLCGFHFANIMEVASKDSSISPCPYIEKYKKCHNASLETYGCAPPDQLHKDAEKFFEFLTQKFLDKCKGDTKSPTYARVSLFSSKR